MTDFDKFAHALALTESDDNEHVWGDNGVAVGRWQMHPAFVAEWTPLHLEVAESWDGLFRDTLKHFYEVRTAKGVTGTKLAMEFHLGVRAVAIGRWDTPYQLRFEEFYNMVLKP